MSHSESLDHMLAAWNELDPSKVRSHLDRALSPEVEFIDPSIETHGIDEFEATFTACGRKFPALSTQGKVGFDSHHGLHRYSWQISRDGEVVLPGFDATEVDDDGKVTRVLGFFGPLPQDYSYGAGLAGSPAQKPTPDQRDMDRIRSIRRADIGPSRACSEPVVMEWSPDR
jgi:hypothetical protein